MTCHALSHGVGVLGRYWIHRYWIVGVILARTILMPSSLDGQQAHRHGFWASAGGGYGTIGAGCGSCGVTDYRSGSVFYARAGGTPIRAVRFGGELALALRETEATSTRLFLASAIGQWHPATASGFYIQVGYGIAHGRQDYQSDSVNTRASHAGVGLVIGTGWDLPLGRVFVSPFAAMYVGALGDIEGRSATGEPLLLKDAIGTVYHVGLSIGTP